MKKSHFLLLIWILAITIARIGAQDSASTGKLEVQISNPTPYVGQVISYSINYSAPADAADIQLQLPDFVGFAQKSQPINQSIQTIDGHQSKLVQQEVILHANRTGTISIKPTTVIIPETPFQSGQILQSDLLTVNVQALPPDPPDSFTGAVGQFDLAVTLDKTNSQSGEPVTLSIAITGSGNFEQIISPAHRLPETWQISSKAPRYQAINAQVGSKTFYWQFIPNQVGDLPLPAIIFSYFDPNTASYHTLTGSALTLSISGEAFQSSDETDIHLVQVPLKPVTSIRSEKAIPDLIFWLLWLIPPFIFFGIVFLQSARSREQSTSPKRSRALQGATQYLSQAQQSDPNNAYRLIEQAILTYLNQVYQNGESKLSTQDVKKLIRQLSPMLQKRLITCLDQAGTGQYAPVTQKDARNLIRQTFEALKEVESEVSK